MNVKTNIDRAFPSTKKRRPRRVKSRQVMIAQLWNDLVDAVLALQEIPK